MVKVVEEKIPVQTGLEQESSISCLEIPDTIRKVQWQGGNDRRFGWQILARRTDGKELSREGRNLADPDPSNGGLIYRGKLLPWGAKGSLKAMREFGGFQNEGFAALNRIQNRVTKSPHLSNIILVADSFRTKPLGLDFEAVIYGGEAALVGLYGPKGQELARLKFKVNIKDLPKEMPAIEAGIIAELESLDQQIELSNKLKCFETKLARK